MAEIQISIKGDKSCNFPAGTTAAEAVKALCSSKERKRTLAVRVGDNLLDLSMPLQHDAELETITSDSAEGLNLLRHSAAHVMAEAVLDIFGKDIMVAIGPATAGRLERFGLRADLVPKEYVAEGLIQALKELDLKGKSVLLARASEARDVLPRELTAAGARVFEAALYQTLPPDGLPPKARQALENG